VIYPYHKFCPLTKFCKNCGMSFRDMLIRLHMDRSNPPICQWPPPGFTDTTEEMREWDLTNPPDDGIPPPADRR
jgi:hypothetical protein